MKKIMPLVERREVSYNTNNNNRKTNRKTIKMISNEGVIIVEEKTELEKWGMYAKEAAKNVLTSPEFWVGLIGVIIVFKATSCEGSFSCNGVNISGKFTV